MTQTSIIDVCEGKHGSNAASAAAFRRLSPVLSKQETAVLEHVRVAGSEGATCLEVARRMGKTPNQISGRFTTLEYRGLIYFMGERDGARVWRLK